jgi:hypothetical protein
MGEGAAAAVTAATDAVVVVAIIATEVAGTAATAAATKIMAATTTMATTTATATAHAVAAEGECHSSHCLSGRGADTRCGGRCACSSGELDDGSQFTFGRDAQHVPWEELVGRIGTLTFTQHGSIALQARLDERNPEYVRTTLKELEGIVSQAMMNKYGSHLTRRLVELCTPEERTALLNEVSDDLVEISKSRFGTWTIQKLVESLSNEEQIRIAKGQLAGHVVELTKCPNGNHVIKYCLQTLAPADNQFIYEALTVDIMDIARHKYGCSMLQRCLDYATEEQARLVSDRVAVNALPLIQDAFGNYIVQYHLRGVVITLRTPGLTENCLWFLRCRYGYY